MLSLATYKIQCRWSEWRIVTYRALLGARFDEEGFIKQGFLYLESIFTEGLI